ncbi:MAG TPA: hydrogenase maturation nickel metallochaperone HypA [Crenotrichaceae bacterium]|nr:hydrogenase maturation nickel metallochaperone HypA [Crenotrichaceae bacterium]
MHELGITRNIIAIVSEQANAGKVIRVTLEIGKLSAIMPDAIRFCFDIVARDTIVDGATLEIREIPGLGRCRECRKEMRLEQLFARCECGSNKIDCIAGEELKIKEIEVN